jgi:hypothetical protein
MPPLSKNPNHVLVVFFSFCLIVLFVVGGKWGGMVCDESLKFAVMGFGAR